MHARLEHVASQSRLPGLSLPTEFALFMRLPPELRLYIWDLALEAESGRLVIFDNHDARRVLLPTRNLARSPLLSVSYESRLRATAVYAVRIDVYSMFAKRRWTLERPPQLRCRLLNASSKASVPSLHHYGVIYLNPKRDMLACAPHIDRNSLWPTLATLRRDIEGFYGDPSGSRMPRLILPDEPCPAALWCVTPAVSIDEVIPGRVALLLGCLGIETAISALCRRLLPCPLDAPFIIPGGIFLFDRG
ncbi:hypothetical protein BX600DRAFT_547168 [Xylariales sp. PMI_506]|nr:hypothetical protein BX600DRAFT_547168 [Xylariales sp. PMI_506]